MIFKDIAEYEDKDSELAKYTISKLHNKIDYLQDRIKELEKDKEIEDKEFELMCRNIDIHYLKCIIYRAIEFIDRHAFSNISNTYDELYNGQIEELVKILKGVNRVNR